MSSYLSYKTVQGIKVPKHFDADNVKYALRYEARPEDKFVVTYPKAGTTWAQQIIALIVNDGVIADPAFTRNSFLDFSGQNTIREPVIKTHLPFSVLPMNPNAKYLLVLRNPKDSCVSFYYHTVKTDPEFNGNFHDFFKLWIKGEVPYGDYFEHTLEYWKHRSERNFQFLVYEEMKRNPKNAILKIAEFLGLEFREKVKNDEKLMNKIIENSTLDTLKNELEQKYLNVLNFFC